MAVLRPSSGTEGFFQDPPRIVNQFQEDEHLRQVVDLYAPHQHALKEQLTQYADQVIRPEVFTLLADAERSPPTLSTHSTFGRARTILNTSYGWRRLQEMGIQAGMVATAYQQGPSPRLHQFAKYHLWTGSSAVVTCPSAMTDGAAKLLQRQLQRAQLDQRQRIVFAEAYRRLTSQDPAEAWTSGQWMTERSGGSDVRGTETVAVYSGDTTGEDADGASLGPWVINGFKWFSSATDSQMTILLAKTDKGLSAFYAPMRQRSSDATIEMNGVSIQRLKNKLGTRALPTAELVLNGMRAWLVGEEGTGIREISVMLNITRIHNAIAALGHWGRALAISRAYTRVRKASGKLLSEHAGHVLPMAMNTVRYAAHMHLGFFVVALLDAVENGSSCSMLKDESQAPALLRLLTPVAKAQCSKEAIYGVQECMESLGGVGYIEDEQEFNIARLFRDANVLSIWEGTTSVMADDVIRVMKGRDGAVTCQTLVAWIEGATCWQALSGLRDAMNAAVQEFRSMASQDADHLKLQGRYLLQLLAWMVAAVCLSVPAADDQKTLAILQAWIADKPRSMQLSSQSVATARQVAFAGSAAQSKL